MFDYYNRLDSLIVDYDLDKLKNLSKDFHNFMSKEDDANLINVSIIRQFQYVIKGIEQSYGEDKEIKELAIQTFSSALRVTVPLFSLNTFTELKYTLFEIRILILLSVTFKKIKVIKLAQLY